MGLIIPVFIVHQGCHHRCSYCNEERAVGDYPSRITEASFRETVYSHLVSNRRKKGPVQIAFYGGTFTGLDKEYQRELLETAGGFIREGLVDSIRISTRPDYIDEKSLDILKRFSVNTVEIGAQSMMDNVLRLSRRGHLSSDIRRAVGLLKERGFETGMHLMAGLPGDSFDGFAETVQETIALRPDTVRIHPTIVFSGTELAEAFTRGDYRPLTMPEAISACKYALGKFTAAGIPVIRLGLQSTPEMERKGSIVAGPFHPAFRALVEEAVFFDMASLLLSGLSVRGRDITFSVSPQDMSSFRGQKNGNISAIKEKFGLRAIFLSAVDGQPRGYVTIDAEGEQRRLTVNDFYGGACGY
jgi:histone acetyltransferase (RNA polymerase elongator complex component)